MNNCLNVSATPTTAMGCQQCLSLSVVQLKGKHCRKPHCHNGVVDTFGHCASASKLTQKLALGGSLLCELKVEKECKSEV